jgi:tetratricopeptide (TPR) repeat protein
VAAILTSLIVALWQGAEARQQRDFAHAQQARAQLAQEFMSFLVTDVGIDGRPVTLEDMLARAEVMLQRQAEAGAGLNGPVYYEIATAHLSLGRTDKTQAQLREAEKAARASRDDDLLAATLCTMAREQLRGQPEESRARLSEGLEVYEHLKIRSAESLVSCERARAIQQEADGAPAEAIETLRSALREMIRT